MSYRRDYGSCSCKLQKLQLSSVFRSDNPYYAFEVLSILDASFSKVLKPEDTRGLSNMGHLTRKDWYAAFLCVIMGVGLIWGSFGYGIGTWERMSPGYFPLLLGVFLVLIGLLLMVAPEKVEADQTSPNESSSRWIERTRPWLCVVAGILVFIGVGTYGGLVPATFLLIIISALGDINNTLKSALALAVGVTVAAIVVFHYGLQMQFPLFTWG